MKRISIDEAVKACKGKLIRGDGSLEIGGASIDSRTVEKGDMFVAIKGENTDGHRFLKQAAANGAAVLLISEKEYADDADCAVILCDDTTKGLQEIARAYRQMLDLKIVAVTGSVGKTGTSDFVKAVCSTKYKTAKTKGNFNNHLGLPITLLSFDPDTQVGVLEMGMDKRGEIEFLAELARPDIGVITNIGVSHIENLGSRENIMKAKMEITIFFGSDNTLVVNGDDEFLSKLGSTPYKLVKVGKADGCEYGYENVKDIGTDGIEFTYRYGKISEDIKLPVFGSHNAMNASLAIAAGMELGITPQNAKEGLMNAELTDRRLSVKEKDGITVIDDTYNASPESMRSALDVLSETKGKRKIAVLADMFELGHLSRKSHFEVGQYAADKDIDILIAVGKEASEIAKGATGIKDIRYFEKREDFTEIPGDILMEGDVILVKGSNAMSMGEIVKKILER